MTDELLAYLLDDLCPERRAAVERQLAEEPELRDELARLERCLAATGDPRACVDEPPRDLVTRTCCLVEQSGSFPRAALAGAGNGCTAVAGPAPWRWSLADYTVCAGVLGVLAMLVLPALRENRDAARRTACANNLRAFGTAVFDYAARHGRQLPPQSPADPVGMLAVELVERGGCDPRELSQSLTCPDSPAADAKFADAAPYAVPTRAELAAARRSALQRLMKATGATALHVGYLTDDQRYHCAMFRDRRGRPFASDAPVVSPHGLYVVVHGGQGLNVLDEGLGVRFVRTCYWTSRRDHMFENVDGQCAAGHDPQDVVLIPGDHWPLGRVVPVREVDAR